MTFKNILQLKSEIEKRKTNIVLAYAGVSLHKDREYARLKAQLSQTEEILKLINKEIEYCKELKTKDKIERQQNECVLYVLRIIKTKIEGEK